MKKYKIYGNAYLVNRMRMYDYLSSLGIVPVRINTDLYDPSRKIWLYEVNNKLLYALGKWYSEKAGEPVFCVAAEPRKTVAPEEKTERALKAGEKRTWEEAIEANIERLKNEQKS